MRVWVKEFGGIKKLAETMEVTDHTIRNWLRGDRSPTSKRIKELIRLSKGQLSFESILKETTRNMK